MLKYGFLFVIKYYCFLSLAKNHFIVCTLRIAKHRLIILQGFAPAFNALAWYYEQYEQNYEQAVQLWEEADLLESPDAALNLGVIYSQGLYPGKPANQVNSAVQAFSKAQDFKPVAKNNTINHNNVKIYIL